MDIIINPTNKCNFSCTFCMAANLEEKTLTSEETIKLLDKYWTDPGMLIINGGDPLMMDPQYYSDLINYTENKFDRPVFISLTTNLYNWYTHPDKWFDILDNRRVGVITSFQFGEKRRLKSGVIYNVDRFKKVIYKFVDTFGYTPDFISVIDEFNQASIYKTAKLAKDLGCKCKLNKTLTLGRAKNNRYFPWYRILALYSKLIDQGLEEYVSNIDNLKNYFKGENSFCPICRKCYHNIRVINNDKRVYTCGNLAVDSDFYRYDLESGADIDSFARNNNIIKIQCLGCENYKFCNSCRTFIAEVKRFNDEENYCKQMKKIIPILEEKLS